MKHRGNVSGQKSLSNMWDIIIRWSHICVHLESIQMGGRDAVVAEKVFEEISG